MAVILVFLIEPATFKTARSCWEVVADFLTPMFAASDNVIGRTKVSVLLGTYIGT